MKHIILLFLLFCGVTCQAQSVTISTPSGTIELDTGRIYIKVLGDLVSVPSGSKDTLIYSVTIPAGLSGPAGANGLPGAIGATGPTGQQGIQGSQGIQGVQGLQGQQGAKGATSIQVTDQKYFVATASPNQAYTIAGLPVSFADFDIFRNRVILYPGIDYKISGNTLTMIIAINQGDKIYYSRKK